MLNQPDFAGRDLSALRLEMEVGVPELLRDMASRLGASATMGIGGFGTTVDITGNAVVARRRTRNSGVPSRRIPIWQTRSSMISVHNAGPA
ncbi:hypothetical protein AB4305_07815 [Nocardia sp. 2YAB30]|uniref:hypothetical protein n=1 Tax=unclassified Nocardia TaxID=2637762 RepID=UPI003F9808E7